MYASLFAGAATTVAILVTAVAFRVILPFIFPDRKSVRIEVLRLHSFLYDITPGEGTSDMYECLTSSCDSSVLKEWCRSHDTYDLVSLSIPGVSQRFVVDSIRVGNGVHGRDVRVHGRVELLDERSVLASVGVSTRCTICSTESSGSNPGGLSFGEFRACRERANAQTGRTE